MAIYNINFNDYTLDIHPSGWTSRWDVYDDWRVNHGVGPKGRRTLYHVPSQEGDSLLSWDLIDGDGDRDDVELLTLVRLNIGSAGVVDCRVYVRCSYSSNVNGYFVQLNDNVFGIYKYVNGVKTTIGSQTFTYDNGLWCWIKFRVNGTSLSAKIWNYGDSEPSWLISETDSDVSGVGWVGIGSYEHGGVKSYSWIGVATNGEFVSEPNYLYSQVSKRSDDCIQYYDDDVGAWVFESNNNSILLGDETIQKSKIGSAMLFDNVHIPSGVYVTQANLLMVGDTTISGSFVKTIIKCEKEEVPVSYGSDILSRDWTDKFVFCDIENTVSGGAYNSVDFTPCVQDVINVYDINSLSVCWDDFEGRSAWGDSASFYSFRGAAQIVISGV